MRYSLLNICNGLFSLDHGEIDEWKTMVSELLWIQVEQGAFFSGIVETGRMKFISKAFLSLPTPIKAKIAE